MEIGDARDRNFERWPIIGNWIWPNYFEGSSYQAEVNFMEDWISDRLSWMDGIINQYDIINSQLITTIGGENFTVSTYPNPFRNRFFVNIDLQEYSKVEISVYSLTGQKIYGSLNDYSSGSKQIEIDMSDLYNYSGILLYEIKVNTERIVSGKILKQ